MAKHGKTLSSRRAAKVDREREYAPAEAVALVKELEAREVRRVRRGPRAHRA